MRFTILIPTWNRDYLIRHAVQSIIDQTFENYELLIVDDGSTDNTEKVVKDMKDKRIRYIKAPHRGLVQTLNLGNREALGQIIVKQDSDDLSLPNRLEVIDKYFNRYPDTEFFYHGMYQLHDSTDAIIRSYFPALPLQRQWILKEQYVPGCFAYTKKFIEKVPYRQLHCSEDWMLILDAFFQRKKIGFVNQGLYEYILRTDSNSMIHENTGHYEEDEQTMKKILKDEYQIENFVYEPRKAIS